MVGYHLAMCNMQLHDLFEELEQSKFFFYLDVHSSLFELYTPEVKHRPGKMRFISIQNGFFSGSMVNFGGVSDDFQNLSS